MSTRRKIWVWTFVSLTGASVAMELVAAFLPSPDRPAWTDLLVGNLPQAIVVPAASLLAAWLPGHFVDAYRRKAAGQPPKGNQ